jgi:Bacterioferritin (cytochrome b1)
MLTNPRISGYLSRALGHELNAVQLYLTQANLCEMWGMQERAECLRKDASEELGHASLLIRRMLLLGLAPNGTQLPPVRPGRDAREMLLLDRELEGEAVRLYIEAEAYCRRFRDDDTADLFGRLLVEEQEHYDHLQRLLEAQRTESAR